MPDIKLLTSDKISDDTIHPDATFLTQESMLLEGLTLHFL